MELYSDVSETLHMRESSEKWRGLVIWFGYINIPTVVQLLLTLQVACPNGGGRRRRRGSTQRVSRCR